MRTKRCCERNSLQTYILKQDIATHVVVNFVMTPRNYNLPCYHYNDDTKTWAPYIIYSFYLVEFTFGISFSLYCIFKFYLRYPFPNMYPKCKVNIIKFGSILINICAMATLREHCSLRSVTGVGGFIIHMHCDLYYLVCFICLIFIIFNN